MDNRGSNSMAFMQGMVMGMIVGGVAGVLLAPKSGAETRADIAAAAQRLQKRAAEIYAEASAAVNKKVQALKKAGKNIDVQEYKKLVDNVVSEMVDASKLSEAEGRKLGAKLKEDSAKVAKAAKA